MDAKLVFRCINCSNVVQEIIEVTDAARNEPTGLKDLLFGQTELVVCKNCSEEHLAVITESSDGLTAYIDGLGTEQARIFPTTPEIFSDLDHGHSNSSIAFCYFISAINDVNDLLKSVPSLGRVERAYYRMLFVQAISALETYLFDQIISEIRGNSARMLRLLATDKEIGQEKVTILSIAQEDQFLERKVINYLKSISYHNLPKVSRIYRNVLEVDFDYKNEENKNFLHNAIRVRHDCVHRNGKDLTGKERSEVDKEFVVYTTTAIVSLVQNVDEKLHVRRANATENRLDDDIPF